MSSKDKEVFAEFQTERLLTDIEKSGGRFLSNFESIANDPSAKGFYGEPNSEQRKKFSYKHNDLKKVKPTFYLGLCRQLGVLNISPATAGLAKNYDEAVTLNRVGVGAEAASAPVAPTTATVAADSVTSSVASTTATKANSRASSSKSSKTKSVIEDEDEDEAKAAEENSIGDLSSSFASFTIVDKKLKTPARTPP